MDNIPVVILCGGRGDRASPLTEVTPKVMMPINGVPIIVHIMKIFACQGFADFVLSVGYRKENIIDYFDRPFLDWNVRVIDTGVDTDTADRIQQCAPCLGERFLAAYGDGLADIDVRKLIEEHRRGKALITLTTVALRTQYGVVRLSSDDKVTDFQEKPQLHDHWINAGFFMFETGAFREFKGENLERQVLPDFARRNQLKAYRHMGFWKSMDTLKDQRELEQLCLTGRPPWEVIGGKLGCIDCDRSVA